MKPEAIETRTLAPTRILEQAKQLAANKQYQAALDLLQRNSLEFEICGDVLRAKMPIVKRRQYHFSKRKSG